MTASNFETLFSGNIDIYFSQFSIESEEPDDSVRLPDVHAGQVNGLCGAAQPERLFFTARPKDAAIELQIQLWPCEPPIDSTYGDIVEVPFTRGVEPVLLCQWAHEEVFPLTLPPGEYRVRYSIDGLDKDYPEDCDKEGYEKPIPGQRYLVQFWAHPNEGDSIIKQTTEEAAYWHKAHSEGEK